MPPGVRYNPNPMKRLLRILLNGATLLSVLLCAASVAMWVRSFSVSEMWQVSTSRRQCYFLTSNKGLLEVGGSTEFERESGEWRSHIKHLRFTPYPSRPSWRGLGFNTMVGAYALNWQLVGTFIYRSYTMPYWFLCLIGTPLPLAWGVRHRSRRRAVRRLKACLCAACGYDLRATSSRCPECGAVPENSPGILN
jgi:hypothetical protein